MRWSRSRRGVVAGPSLPSEDYWRLLAEFYRDDLADFSALTGLDISDWPTVRRLAPIDGQRGGFA